MGKQEGSLTYLEPLYQVRDVVLSQPLVAKGLRKVIVDWLNLNEYPKKAKRLANCGITWLLFRCIKKHEKYIRLHCGFDYCPSCGREDSWFTRRRYIRALDRIIHLGTVRYVDLTLPKKISESWLNRNTLNYLMKQAWLVVKDNLQAAGCGVRVHLVGEKSKGLHVHFNVLFAIDNKTGTGMVLQEVLDSIRAQWTKVVNDCFGLSYPNINVWYDFAPEIGRRFHRVRYVFGSAVMGRKFKFLSENDKHWVVQLSGFHKTRWFGKLANNKYKEYLKSKGINPTEKEDSDVSFSNICPVDGEKFKRVGVVSEQCLPRPQLRAVDKDTLVDFSVKKALEERDRWKNFDSDASVEDIVKRYS